MAAQRNAGHEQRVDDVQADYREHPLAVLREERAVLLREHAQKRNGHEQSEDAGRSASANRVGAHKDVGHIRNHIAGNACDEVQQEKVPPAKQIFQHHTCAVERRHVEQQMHKVDVKEHRRNEPVQVLRALNCRREHRTHVEQRNRRDVEAEAREHRFHGEHRNVHGNERKRHQARAITLHEGRLARLHHLLQLGIIDVRLLRPVLFGRTLRRLHGHFSFFKHIRPNGQRGLQLDQTIYPNLELNAKRALK